MKITKKCFFQWQYMHKSACKYCGKKTSTLTYKNTHTYVTSLLIFVNGLSWCTG